MTLDVCIDESLDTRGEDWSNRAGGSGIMEEGVSMTSKDGSYNVYSLRRKKRSLEEFKRDDPVKFDAKRPRWYNQTYVIFLALRLAKRPLPRAVLIPRALELSEILSKRLGFPRLFGGKTPKNTASGLLTENRDKMFLSFTDEKSKKIYFTPSFEPGNFEQALSRYNFWMSELAENVWPIQFGNVIQSRALSNTTSEDRNENYSTPNNKDGDPVSTVDSIEQVETEGDKIKNETGTIFIPKTVEDIFEVKTSTIPNSGKGLFAKIYIPPRIILGYYFGVPYPEDEFDYKKGTHGHANEFAHKYRLTVLDATDENGAPFYNHPKVFCPFHFINENVDHQNLAFIEGLDVNQIFCMSTKPIYPGDETFVSYGPDVERPWLNIDKKDDPLVCVDSVSNPPKSLYDYLLPLYGNGLLSNSKKKQKMNGTLSPSTSSSSIS